MLKRLSRLRLKSLDLVLVCASLACVSLASCTGSAPQPARLALIDPLGILDNVTSDLRLLVLPADGHACGADGRVAPSLPDTPGAVIDSAVVDISFAIADGASVLLDPGSYTVLVRGRGTDPISGIGPNELIATGCQTGVVVVAAETGDISIEMKQIINGGICGDGVLSPDEQCEGSLPGPCASCVTSAYDVSTTALSADARAAPPRIGFATGARLVAGYEADSGKLRMMLLDEQGQPISSPTALALDEQVDVGAPVSGVQTQASVASSPARIAVAFAGHFVAVDPGGDALVRFFDNTRTPLGAPATTASGSTGAQGQPSVALMADGTALVAFTNDQSTTGASVRLFAAGSVTPMGSGATPLGAGLSGITAPSVAASGGGFVVGFAAGGEVYAQRFGADGSALDATAILVTDGVDGTGTQSSAQVGALTDGRFAVAFLDESSTKIRARSFDASGVATGAAIDLSGAGASAPTLAAGRERFAAAWIEGGSVMARLLDGAGDPALNREAMPSGDAFVVATAGSSPSVAAGGPASQGILAVGFINGGALQARLYPIP